MLNSKNFNQQSSKTKMYHLLMCFYLLIQIGCFRDAEKKDNTSEISNTAEFILKNVSGVSKSLSASSEWSLPTAKIYDFRACIKAKVTSSDLGPGHKFTVVRPDKSVFYVETDDKGCVNWQEKIDFNLTSDSKYVELNRILKGSDLYKGELPLKIGVNPWSEFRSESGEEVVNLDEKKIPTSHLVSGENSELAFSGFYEKSFGEDLLINDEPSTEFQLIKDDEKGKTVRVTIKVKPFIEPLNLAGEPVPYYFKKGNFRVYPQLVANYLGRSGSQRMILVPLLPKDLSITQNGTLVYQETITFSRQVTMGQIELALKVEAINSPLALQEYEGLHSVSVFDKIFGKHSSGQIQGVYTGKIFNYTDYITKAQNFEVLKKQGVAFNLNPIRFKEMDIRFVRVAPGETATRRTIIYRTQVEVVDSITGAPVRKQPFRIEKDLTGKVQTRSDLSGGSSDVIYTNDDGVLKWTDEISHLFYIAEQFYYPEVRITHLNSNYKETLKQAINPWNSGWTFGSDYRGREQEYEAMNKQEKRDSLFMIDAFRYQTIRFRYEIDQHMTLNVQKAVVMALDPLTQRYTIEEGRKGGEPLRDGIYLVKIALVKYFIDPFTNGVKLFRDENNEHRFVKTSESDETKKGRYMTVIKKLLRVQGGRITTPLEFSMRDLRMMSIRSNIMVQIETVDEQRLQRDNIVDRKLRDLVDTYNAYNSEGMTDEDKDLFIEKNQQLFIAEREKLASAMKQELNDLQNHRLQLADAQAARHKALNDFEDRVKSEQSLHDRKEALKTIVSMEQDDFKNYIESARSSLDQMELKFSSYWRQWNKDMGLPSNELHDWASTGWDKELGIKSKPENIKMGRIMYENPDKERIGLGQNKSVYDYLETIQLFLKEHKLPEDISIRDLNSMKLNNYTQNPAAPFIDLNLYRNNAGLKKRTFIGPCTLVANDNMSEMRPTDTIDEKYCDRIDCSDKIINFGYHADNKVFEESAYHGAIKPFANMHVDNIIELYKGYEREYYDGMRASSQLGRFLETYNMEYVSLNDNAIIEKPKKFKKLCVVDPDESEYHPEAFDGCYEDIEGNVTSVEVLNQRLKRTDSEDLLRDFFKYKDYDADEVTEIYNNTMPSLFGLAKDNFWDTTVEAQEALTGGNIGDLIRSAGINRYNKNKYIDDFVKDKFGTFDDDFLVNMIHSTKEKLSLLESTKLCGLLTESVASDLKSRGLLQERSIWQKRGQFTSDHAWLKVRRVIKEKCLKSIEFNPNTGAVDNSLLSFDRRYRVIETGTYEHKEGKNLNINVGYGFEVSDGEVNTITGSLGLDGASVGGALFTALVGGAASLVTNGAAVPATVGASAALLSGSVIANKTASNSVLQQMTRGSSVSTATFLVVQQASMEIELKKFERCFTANLMPSLFYGFNGEDLGLKDDKKVYDADVAESLSRGLMVCEGKLNEEPEKVIENYYYISQHFTAGDMLDEGNLLNHIWLLPLRGVRDFNNFMNITKSTPINKKGEDIEESDRYIYSNAKLRKNYNQILPSFPGMYTVQGIK